MDLAWQDCVFDVVDMRMQELESLLELCRHPISARIVTMVGLQQPKTKGQKIWNASPWSSNNFQRVFPSAAFSSPNIGPLNWGSRCSPWIRSLRLAQSTCFACEAFPRSRRSISASSRRGAPTRSARTRVLCRQNRTYVAILWMGKTQFAPLFMRFHPSQPRIAGFRSSQ